MMSLRSWLAAKLPVVESESRAYELRESLELCVVLDAARLGLCNALSYVDEFVRNGGNYGRQVTVSLHGKLYVVPAVYPP
jgi:hypothetical protein